MVDAQTKLDVLTMYARVCIEVGKELLEGGEHISPRLMIVNSRGDCTLNIITGETDAETRHLIVRKLVEEQDGVGFVHFGDAYIWDQTMTKLLGERLMAIIQIKGHPQLSTTVSCDYTRDPFKFDEVKVERNEGFTRPVWDEDVIKH